MRVCFYLSLIIVCTMLAVGCGESYSTEPSVTIHTSLSLSDRLATIEIETPKPDQGPANFSDGYGNLVGKVLFEGTVPTLPPEVLKGKSKNDPLVCAVKKDIPDESLLVGPNGGLANVFIYLVRNPIEDDNLSEDIEELVFDQKNCIFTTHALIARTHQKILVKNDDPIVHNANTFPERNRPENFAIKPDDRQGIALVYSKPEPKPFLVKCDIHTWMRSFHLPLDHPYAAVTKEDGSFEIPNLPAGKHTFRVWHEKAYGKGDYLTRKFDVTIEANKTTESSLSFDQSKFIK